MLSHCCVMCYAYTVIQTSTLLAEDRVLSFGMVLRTKVTCCQTCTISTGDWTVTGVGKRLSLTLRPSRGLHTVVHGVAAASNREVRLRLLWLSALTLQGLKTVWVRSATFYYEPMWSWRMLLGQRRRWMNGEIAPRSNGGRQTPTPSTEEGETCDPAAAVPLCV
jgi:hypothetical protein